MGLPLGLAESFDILGVKPGDNPGEIRSAFRRLALTCHPDVAGSKHAARFERIEGAEHMVMIDRPGPFLAATERFLA